MPAAPAARRVVDGVLDVSNAKRYLIGKFCPFFAIAILFAPFEYAYGGEEVSIAKELRNIEAELDELPPRRKREVEEQIRDFSRQLRTADNGHRSEVIRRIKSLEAELTALEKLGTRHFPGVSNKVGVFTFEDPDDSGLGDDLAFIFSKRVLFHADVGSLAVVNFQQGLAPDSTGKSYFDKIAKVTAGQGYFVTVWGQISQIDGGYALDVYLEFDPSRRDDRFEFSLRVQDLSDELRARVAPRRVWIQSVQFKDDAVQQLKKAANEIRKLRQSPEADDESTTVSVVGRLEEGTRYWLSDRKASWVKVELRDGTRGWTSVEEFCIGPCKSILGAADFVSELMRYASFGEWNPDLSELTLEAGATTAQIRILIALQNGPEFDQALEIASTWRERRSTSSGAGFENFHTVASIGAKANNGALEMTTIESLTDRLARATLADPGNLDALHNLAVLFDFVGDEGRSRLATDLYTEQSSRISGEIHIE